MNKLRSGILVQLYVACTAIPCQILVDLAYEAAETLINCFHKHIKFLVHKSLRFALFFAAGIHSHIVLCGHESVFITIIIRLILKFFLAIPAQKREESSIPPAVYVGFNRL